MAQAGNLVSRAKLVQTLKISQDFFEEEKIAEKICWGGGIGIHERLKTSCPLGLAGSSPAPSTSILELVQTHFAACGGEAILLRKFGKMAACPPKS